MIVYRIIYKFLKGLGPGDLGIEVGHDTYNLTLRSQTSHKKTQAGGRLPHKYLGLNPDLYIIYYINHSLNI